ncbi:MAG: site-specific integrase [Gammaproteobacteria bacterium]|nr:site-specific integrase [Gammaproteobacteria bacterium]
MPTKNISQSERNKALIAMRFYRLHHPAGKADLVSTQNALLNLSFHLVKDAWRIQRNAIAFMFENVGQYDHARVIHEMKNPVSLPENRHLRKKKRGDCKRVLETEHSKIVQYILKRNKPNWALLAVLEVVRETGVRPCEIDKMTFNADNSSLDIISAKKTEDGLRGLDRTLYFDTGQFNTLTAAHKAWKQHKLLSGSDSTKAMKLLQDQLARVTKALFPRRKNRITFKSYRHQFGSNLKASGWTRRETAAAMGHQSVNSLSLYGNIRNASRLPEFSVSRTSVMNVRNTVLKTYKSGAEKLCLLTVNAK